MIFKNLFGKGNSEKVFWDWFEKNSAKYLQLDEHNMEVLFEELSKQLKKVSKGLTFEFSVADENATREFIISADGNKKYFPDVLSLVRAAPSLENWKILAFRQRSEGDWNLQINHINLSPGDAFFTYSKGDGKLDLELYLRGFDESQEYMMASLLMLDAVLGEYDMETRIGRLTNKKLEEAGTQTLFKISELPKIVDAYIQEINN